MCSRRGLHADTRTYLRYCLVLLFPLQALAAWYSDEVGDAAALPKPAVASSKESEPQQAQQQGGDEPGGRQLRQRAAVAGGAGSGRGGGGASERQRANWDRPLVVIVEGTESLDAGCLRDVVATLSEVRRWCWWVWVGGGCGLWWSRPVLDRVMWAICGSCALHPSMQHATDGCSVLQLSTQDCEARRRQCSHVGHFFSSPLARAIH